MSRSSRSAARVGLFSLRKKDKSVSRFNNFEFENVVCQIDDAELVMPEPIGVGSLTSRIADRLVKRLPLRRINPGVLPIKLEKDYELLFVNCLFLPDLRALMACTNWRERSQKAVCCLTEVWSDDLDRYDRFIPYLELLSRFDYVFTFMYNSVDAIQKRIGKPVFYMLHGIDSIRFSPFPRPPRRCIDVYSMGRKSEVTHRALLEFCEREGLFYVFDTFENMTSQHIEQHRGLLASLIKRSRYFVANYAKINTPAETCGHTEIGQRFVEGAAGGAVMVGMPPVSELFLKYFDWPDAVIPVPYDSTDIGAVLTELDKDQERLGRIRTHSVVNSLLRNDYVYRWARILDELGMAYTERMKERVRHLHHLAELARSQTQYV